MKRGKGGKGRNTSSQEIYTLENLCPGGMSINKGEQITQAVKYIDPTAGKEIRKLITTSYADYQQRKQEEEEKRGQTPTPMEIDTRQKRSREGGEGGGEETEAKKGINDPNFQTLRKAWPETAKAHDEEEEKKKKEEGGRRRKKTKVRYRHQEANRRKWK